MMALCNVPLLADERTISCTIFLPHTFAEEESLGKVIELSLKWIIIGIGIKNGCKSQDRLPI